MAREPLDSIRDFLVLSEARNFREAASELGLSPAALSIRIKQLEAHLGLPLLEWRGRAKILSPAGVSLKDSLGPSFKSLTQRLAVVRDKYQKGGEAVFRVAGRSEVCSHASRIFKEQTRLEFTFCSSPDALKKMMAGEVEFAITYNRPDSTDYIEKVLFKSDCHVMTALEVESPAELVLDKALFLRTRWLSYLKEDPFLSRVCARHGVSLRDLSIVATCDDWNSFSGFVEAGIGSAITPTYVLPPANKRVHTELLSDSLFPPLSYSLLCSKTLLQIPIYRDFLKSVRAF